VKLKDTKQFRRIVEIVNNIEDLDLDVEMDVISVIRTKKYGVCDEYTIIPATHPVIIILRKCDYGLEKPVYTADIVKLTTSAQPVI